MNDEIKEILEQLEWYRKIGKKDVYYPECVLPNKKAFILLDYIINLQQDMKNYVDIVLYQRKTIDNLQQENEDYKSRCEKASEQAKEKIKRYESYINDLKKGNYPSSTIKQERQELIFRIREQEDLLNILQNGSDEE